MKPERNSIRLLGMTQSQAKMIEYSIPEEYHIKLTKDPSKLFILTIGLIGDAASKAFQDDSNIPTECDSAINFSARFFDSYLQSELNHEMDEHVLLIGSAAYYLANMPGSSSVLAKRIESSGIRSDANGLNRLLSWLLIGSFSTPLTSKGKRYSQYIAAITHSFARYYADGTNKEELFKTLKSFRQEVYLNGTPRELLLCDLSCAIAKRRYFNSAWYSLPNYTELPPNLWYSTIVKPSFIRELWPAQHLLGINNVFKGVSAVVQMPTSAGKTKATEIIIRSAFLTGRTNLAIIVAPFRALCHEISDSLNDAFKNEETKIDELTDVLQADFDFDSFFDRKQILVLTPEKFAYILRHEATLASKIGLLIYDEGHQFDSGSRGVTYELLLSSLKKNVPAGCQTILISAVISNAAIVGSWLNGEAGVVVSGQRLIPTYRTIGFASWKDHLGRLQFVDPQEPSEETFFVPRVIESQRLSNRPREKREIVFPAKQDGRTVALYLGLKLCKNGCVAIFCGTKSIASWFCETAVDVYSRNLLLPAPSNFSNHEELAKLYSLHAANLGIDASCTQSAKIGILAHHGNTPKGIRLSVEYSLQKGHIPLVICTSTLAQGVNLPIKYLIVSSIYQGQDRIKVRDFHNLIGRAGRSGKHTEGSVIFADPEIFDSRKSDDNKSWREARLLLNPDNSEPCGSSLFTIFSPLQSENGFHSIKMDALTLAKTYIQSPEKLASLPDLIAEKLSSKTFTREGIAYQIQQKLEIIYAIESYLMAHLDQDDFSSAQEEIQNIAKDTLAFTIADAQQKQDLLDLFRMLGENILQHVPIAAKRGAFSKSLKGVLDCLAIEKWVNENRQKLRGISEFSKLIECIWPIFYTQIANRTFKKVTPPDVLIFIIDSWCRGKPYYELLEILNDRNVRIGSGSRPRYPTMDHVIDICENGVSFDGTLVVAAISEILQLDNNDEDQAIIETLALFQKQLKYGLYSKSSILLYEIGLSDRVISQQLAALLKQNHNNKSSIIGEMRENPMQFRQLILNYPSYFENTLERLLSEGII